MPRRPADPHASALAQCPGLEATPEDRTRWVLARAMELGFHAAGVCGASPSAEGDRLRAWLAAGKHGAMEWMREHVDTRLDVRALHPGARSVIVVLLRYSDGSPDRVDRAPSTALAGGTAPGHVHRPRGRVARYARGPDYHDLMKRRLGRLQRELELANPGAHGRRTCDIEPAMERELAVRAGLGRIGKHTLLISPSLGSWTLIATLITTVELAPTGPGPSPEDPCQSCTRCIDACPTHAIEPWSVDARRCISALTLEDRGALDPALAARMEDWIGGCDICQEVCPHNHPTRRSRDVGTHHAWSGGTASFDLLSMLEWTDTQRRAAWRAGALRRMSAAMAARNAVWALHSAGPEWDGAVQRVAGDSAAPDLVRHAARDALDARRRTK
jgi:epoxyqueuosine reductase